MDLTLAQRELFEPSAAPNGDPLVAAASHLAAQAGGDACSGELVIVVRPATDQLVVADGTTGVLRASVSVATVADDTRMWDHAPAGETIEVTTRDMPEAVATAADASAIRVAHVGRARFDDVDEAVAIWFEGANGVAGTADRRLVLAALAEAASKAADWRAANTPAQPVDDGPRRREFDATDPRLDAATGLFTAEHFLDTAYELECDEASVLVIETGMQLGDDSARTLADRLVETFGRTDVVARLGESRFAVLSPDSMRGETIGRARELLEMLAQPLDDPAGEPINPIVALAHEVGLIDIDDMIDAAEAAAAEGSRSGGGRLVLAA